MIMVKMEIAGIQIQVPEGEVSFYKRAGYTEVVEKPVVSVDEVSKEDAKIIAKIAKVTKIADLYKFQVEGRSEAVENAINAKGLELSDLEKQQAEKNEK